MVVFATPQMVKEAIGSLKERTGSSQYAIAKYLEDTYKTGLPPNFKKTLSIQLRNLTKQGKVYKVKNSFKLSDELKKPTKAAPKPPVASIKEVKEVKETKAPKATKVAKKSSGGRVKKTPTGASVPKSLKTTAAAKTAKAPKSLKASKPEIKPAIATKPALKRKAPAATIKKVEEKPATPARKPTASPARKPAAVRKTTPKKVVSPKKSQKSVKAAKPKTVKAAKGAKPGKTSKTAVSPAKKAKK
jgi:histone H1/5